MPQIVDPVLQSFLAADSSEQQEFDELTKRLISALQRSGAPNEAAFKVLTTLYKSGTAADAHAADRLVIALWDSAAGEHYVKSDWGRLQQLVQSRFLRLRMLERAAAGEPAKAAGA